MSRQADDPQHARPTPTASPWQVAGRRLNLYRIAGLIFVLGFSAAFWMVVLYAAIEGLEGHRVWGL
jgi:hypothetical protein